MSLSQRERSGVFAIGRKMEGVGRGQVQISLLGLVLSFFLLYAVEKMDNQDRGGLIWESDVL
jgi:hypothetical protein